MKYCCRRHYYHHHHYSFTLGDAYTCISKRVNNNTKLLLVDRQNVFLYRMIKLGELIFVSTEAFCRVMVLEDVESRLF
jgi:hypothetical protein